MKTLTITLLVALGVFAAVGCTAPASEDADEESTSATEQAPAEHVESQSSSLINSSSGGAGWSAGCKACKDDCDSNYPRGGGPLETCKKLCVMAGTCSTTKGPGWGGGPIAF